MLAIGIKTFMRDETLLRLLDSIDQFLPELKIYIADDSPINGNKEDRYRLLEEMGHHIIRLPFDVGLSAGRNVLMSAIQEPYVLYCDDDYIFGANNGVKETLLTLKKRPDIGMITGLLTCSGVETGFNLNQKKWEDIDGVKICQTDRGLNFFIARREMFSDVHWNPEYKINKEHEDFFKRAKKTKWKIYYCPVLRAEHDMRKASGEYSLFRNRMED